MPNTYAGIAFTPAVREEQQKHGSRRQYQRMEQMDVGNGRLGPEEAAFIAGRDGFYLATVSETGWPYIQYRGGAKGFLRVVDEQTLEFGDLRGNKQYITTGNLRHDGRVALFLMDYAQQRRLKIFGRVTISEPAAPPANVERILTIHVEAYDWNCPQHITPRFTIEEFQALTGSAADAPSEGE